MQHCTDSVKAFEMLSAGERQAFVENLVHVEARNTLKSLLITCARLHSWTLLAQSLKTPEVREVLWAVIDDMLDIAHRDNVEDNLCNALPEALSNKEGRMALVFPCRISHWPLAEALFSKGAMPGRESFTRAFSDYQSRQRTLFEFKLISSAVQADGFPWAEILSFGDGASVVDILKRGANSSKPAYLVCALALMDDEQKAYFVEDLYNQNKIDTIYSHIVISGEWMKYLPANVKGKILSDDIGM